MQRKEVVKSQTRVTEQGMTVQMILVLLIWTDPVDQDLIQVQRERKILPHKEKSRKENQTKTDTTKLTELLPHM